MTKVPVEQRIAALNKLAEQFRAAIYNARIRVEQEEISVHANEQALAKIELTVAELQRGE